MVKIHLLQAKLLQQREFTILSLKEYALTDIPVTPPTSSTSVRARPLPTVSKLRPDHVTELVSYSQALPISDLTDNSHG